MCKKQFLLLVLMVSIVAAPGWAAIIETFTVQDAFTIDANFEGETPGTMSGTIAGVHSGFLWGGQSDDRQGNATSNNRSIDANGRWLVFNSNTIRTRAYAYTIFDPNTELWHTPEITIDLSGGSAQVQVRGDVAQNDDEEGTVVVGLKLLIRDAAGDWFLRETEFQLGSPVTTETVPIPGTWTEVTGGHDLDALAGSDEGQLSFGTEAAGSPDLSAVTGGGIHISTRPKDEEGLGANRSRDVRIHHIIWKEDSSAYDTPPYVHAGSDREGNWVPSEPPGDEEAHGYVAIQGTNLEVSDDLDGDPDHEWILISKPIGAPDPVFVRKNSPYDKYPLAGQDEFAMDPNAYCPATGEYTIALLASDGGQFGADYMDIDVRENHPPTVGGVGGNDDRTVYVATGCELFDPLEVLGPWNIGLQYSSGTPPYDEIENGNGFFANINDDGFPRDGSGYPYKGDLSMFWKVIEQPDDSAVTFWKTDGKGGARVESIDTYYADDGEDPNIMFDTVGEYRLHLMAYDGVLWNYPADPNGEAYINVIDNQVPTVNAGDDLNAILKDNDFIFLEGTAGDDDYPKCPNSLKTTWYVDSGPAGATFSFDDASSLTTKLTFVNKTEGAYTLRLQAHDGHPETGDANDFMDILVSKRKFVKITIRPSDDTFIRGNRETTSFGGDFKMDNRGGPDHTSSDYRSPFVKFDLDVIPGSVQHLVAKLTFMPEDNFQWPDLAADMLVAGETGDTIVRAVTYGPSSGWSEGPTTDEGEQLTTDPKVALTMGNFDMVIGDELDRWDYILGDDTGTENGGSALKGEIRTPPFNVDNMVIESDNSVTFQILTDQWNDNTRQIYTKEAVGGDGGLTAGMYGGAELTVYYDPNQPYRPSPGNMATGLNETSIELGWKSHGNDTFDIYFSSSKTLVEDLNPSVKVGSASAKPGHDLPDGDPNVWFDLTGVTGTLDRSTVYYWIVDPDMGANSDLWQLRTIDPPVLVNPQEGDVVRPGRPFEAESNRTSQPEYFQWSGGAEADSFDLYISTNESDVVNMTGFKVTDVESPYEPNQAFVLTLSTYNLNDDSSQSERDLYWSTAAVYYWRIVGNVDGGDPLISPVQSFGVDQYDLIDNFSDYDNGFDNRKGKWSASGGATITWINSDPPGTPGYGGNNLEMVYNDNAGASRATFLFVEPRDWSPAVNRHVISFQFLGFDGNDREDVYFTVTDTSNNSHSEAYDPNEFEKYYGNPWLDFGRTYFDLAPFADAGVNLSSVKSYGYGIGDGLEPMGQGTVHFDGGQIWSRHCRAGKFDYMFAGGDCNVDANEVLDLVERWLAVPETIIAAGSIPSDSLELHFTFDDDTTTDTLLSSNELAGLLTLDLNAGNVFQVTPGFDGATGGCIEVSRITEIRKRGIEGTLSNANPSCSASIWLKGNDVIGEDFGNLDPDGEMDGLRAWRMRGNNLVNGGGNSWILDMRVPHDDGGIEMRMDSFDAAKSQQNLVFDQDDTVPADWQGQWNHLAFTWDGVSGTTALYHNGRRVDREGFDADDYEDKAGVFMGELIDRINLPDNNRYTGLIDEFRFYSRVLTHSEVLALAGEASMEVPVDGTGADTNNDGVFNMADLAEISAHWGLREVLWP